MSARCLGLSTLCLRGLDCIRGVCLAPGLCFRTVLLGCAVWIVYVLVCGVLLQPTIMRASVWCLDCDVGYAYCALIWWLGGTRTAFTTATMLPAPTTATTNYDY